jgi:hypothetical protein
MIGSLDEKNTVEREHMRNGVAYDRIRGKLKQPAKWETKKRMVKAFASGSWGALWCSERQYDAVSAVAEFKAALSHRPS